MTDSATRAYWIRSAGEGELREEELPAEPRPGHSLVRALWSGISPGTERLVGRAEVPLEGADRMACKYMQGDFRLPLKYGYCMVASGEQGELAGRRIFVMHPHQERMEVSDADAIELPEGLPSQRALLLPNLETALNAVWDAEITSEDSILVVGAGAVGVLVAYVLARSQRAAPTCIVVDSDPDRLAAAARLPWVARTAKPEELEREGATLAFHTSGNPAGLQTSLDAVGFEGRVVELSWYGSKRVELDLGMSFHYQRKRLISSQVGTVAPSMRATLGRSGRLARVLELLSDDALDAMLAPPLSFEDLPAFMGELYRGACPSWVPAVRYV